MKNTIIAKLASSVSDSFSCMLAYAYMHFGQRLIVELAGCNTLLGVSGSYPRRNTVDQAFIPSGKPHMLPFSFTMTYPVYAQSWLAYIETKQYHFDAVAHYRMSLVEGEASR